jgi:predicted homoserine dehydrogenase-like protein
MLSDLLIRGQKIKIGIIGIGSMGKGLIYQSRLTPEIDCVAIADIQIDRCIAVLDWLGLEYGIANNQLELEQIISQGKMGVCADGELIAQCKLIEAIIESSNSIIPAAHHALAAINSEKDIILMNSEIDLIFGPYLAEKALKNGVVYTSCDGDQYGVIKHLIDDLRFWGFELVMAGNIKGFLNRYANPTTIIPEAEKRNLDYKMCTSYTDGTKLNIEMAILANAYGLETVVPGMKGPQANDVKEVFTRFDFDTLYQKKQPFVDYILGAEPGGGVFAIGYCEDQYQQEMLAYYKMGPGPYYLFYRPYHLCHIEAMSSAINAVRYRKSFLKPNFGLLTNVFAYAKINLLEGETLDGIGGYTCYGMIENRSDNSVKPGLPICLADDVKLKRNIPKDGKILMNDITYDKMRIDFNWYREALDK